MVFQPRYLQGLVAVGHSPKRAKTETQRPEILCLCFWQILLVVASPKVSYVQEGGLPVSIPAGNPYPYWETGPSCRGVGTLAWEEFASSIKNVHICLPATIDSLSFLSRSCVACSQDPQGFLQGQHQVEHLESCGLGQVRMWLVLHFTPGN